MSNAFDQGAGVAASRADDNKEAGRVGNPARETDAAQGGAGEQAQIVDPAVSRSKFQAQLDEYRLLDAQHTRRGWWLLEATFPRVFVVFATPQLRPPAVICGVELDFTDYDLEPPSVRLVDPFSREPYRRKDLPTALLRRQLMSFPPGVGGPQFAGAVPLMQAHDLDEIPFLCIPGVREYHSHPAHTGDSWLAHRGSGVGTLFHILNTIYQYGVQPITSFSIGLQVVGFQQAEPPA